MIMFDDAVIEGNVNDKLLSFEDAVIDSTYISFSKMNLNNVGKVLVLSGTSSDDNVVLSIYNYLKTK